MQQSSDTATNQSIDAAFFSYIVYTSPYTIHKSFVVFLVYNSWELATILSDESYFNISLYLGF